MNKVNNGNDFNDHFSDHGIRLINENKGPLFTNLINKLSSQKKANNILDGTNNIDCISYSQYGTYPIDDSNLSNNNRCWKSLKDKFNKLHGS